MRDEDIIRYIDLAKKKIPYFLKKIQGKVEGLITFDDIESEVMFNIIQYYDTMKNFELENPDDIERYFDMEEDKTYYVDSRTKENGTLVSFEVYTKDAM